MLPHWTEAILTLKGNRINYIRTGNGEKPPLVLAHGFSDNGLCWIRAASELEANYDVILPDARGHGLSERINPEETIDMAADLASLIQTLGLDHPVIGGHSMGASVSAQVDARFPGLVRALVLEDPGWLSDQPKSTKQEEPQPFNPWIDFLMKAADMSLDEVVAKCKADSPTWAEIEWLPWAVSKQQFDPAFLQAQNGPHAEWTEVVQAITCPTLLLTSNPDKGGIVTAESAELAASLNSLMKVVNIPGAGHNIRRENFPAFMEAVRDFLDDIYL
jgi:N-formylmaleamate deformylase